MSEYLSLVISVALAASVGGALIYNSERTLASRTAISVVLLFAVLSPIPSLLDALPTLSLPEIPSGDTVADGEYARVAEDAFADGIGELLAEKYSLPEECFAVKLTGFDVNLMRAEKITVTLRDGAVRCDPLAVARYLNSFGVGECYAEIGL